MTTNENKQNDERTAFEAWANVEGFDVKRGIHRDNYAGAITESLWAAWQARATQQATTGDERAEIERCAKICESVMEQSRNHLFRSAAKICAMSIRNPTQPCDRAPEGWMCSRIAGHEGPCAASQITKEWCVKMAAVEPEEGVPPAGLAALDDSATVIPVSPEELAKMFTPSPVAGSAGQAPNGQEPYAYAYEWDTPFGLHRDLQYGTYNGAYPNRTIALYTETPTAPSLATDAGAVLTTLQIAEIAKRFEHPSDFGTKLNWLGFARALLAAHPTEQHMSDAVRDVLTERARQVNVEGWTPEHDDKYQFGEMALAGAAYASESITQHGGVPSLWPWGHDWWKPGTARRMLVKGGALIIAEIERIDRADRKAQEQKAC